jgi:hypothetical protein
VPEIVRQVSDDQIALIVCFAAVVVSGLMMHFSIHIGRITGRVRLPQSRELASVLTPETRSAPMQPTENITVRQRAA